MITCSCTCWIISAYSHTLGGSTTGCCASMAHSPSATFIGEAEQLFILQAPHQFQTPQPDNSTKKLSGCRAPLTITPIVQSALGCSPLAAHQTGSPSAHWLSVSSLAPRSVQFQDFTTSAAAPAPTPSRTTWRPTRGAPVLLTICVLRRVGVVWLG